MSEDRSCLRKELRDDRHGWQVVHNLSRDFPIDAAELDVIEAFLMPLVNAVLSQESTDVDSGHDPPKHDLAPL
jgi:hypothetical protein